MRVRLDLDAETTERLVEVAVTERRPVAWQAEVLLRRALGLADRPAETPTEPKRGEVARC